MTTGAEKIIERIKEIDRLDKKFFNEIFKNSNSTLNIFVDECSRLQFTISEE